MVRFYTEVFTKAEYGIIDLITTTAGFIIPIITMGINEAVFRFSMDNNEERKNVFSQGVIVAFVGNVVVASLLMLFDFGPYITRYRYLFILFCFIDCFYIMISNFCRGMEKSTLYAVSGILNSILHLVFVVVFLVGFNLGISGYFYAFSLSNIITITVLLFALRKQIEFSLKPQINLLKSMLIYSIPLIANNCCWWLLSSMDKYVIAWQLGSEANGIFAAASKLPSLLTMLSTIFFQAWQLSSVQESQSEDKQKFYSEMHDFIYIGLAIASSALMAVIKPIYLLLVGDDFSQGWVYTPFLILAMLFSALASFYSVNYIAMKKTKGALYTSLTAAIANMILNVILTAKFGIFGTAFATMLSYMLLWVITIWDTSKFVKIKTNIVKMLLTIIILLIQAFMISFGIANMLAHVVLLTLLVLIHLKQLRFIVGKFLSNFRKGKANDV